MGLAWKKTFTSLKDTFNKLVIWIILIHVLILQYSTSKDMLLKKMILKL